MRRQPAQFVIEHGKKFLRHVLGRLTAFGGLQDFRDFIHRPAERVAQQENSKPITGASLFTGAGDLSAYQVANGGASMSHGVEDDVDSEGIRAFL